MGDVDVQVCMRNVSGLPEDIAVNTLHFDNGFPDTGGGLADGIHATYMLLKPILSSDYPNMTIKLYSPGINPGGPFFQKDYAFPGGGAPGPSETAVCLSYATVDNPDASLPRRRGRIYVGPLAASAQNAKRPDATLRDYVLDFGQNLASVGFASNTTWKMLSRIDNAYFKIQSIWCDDAWDTQRRRGLSPTLREVRDVQ
jgi:hypothetical protein